MSVSIKQILMGLFCLGLISAFLPNSAAAQEQNGWQATYWNNIELAGDPVLKIFETDRNGNPSLDRNWGNWRPWPQVDTNFFSARWTRTEVLQPGRYRFTGTADDGMRVFVNGTKIIDEWQNTVVTAYTGYYDVDREGPVTITVEYYEYQHDAIAKLFWDRVYASDTIRDGQPFQPTITAWKGEYFNGREPGALADFVRNDETIDFDWGLDSPEPVAIRSEQFSVRWTRTLDLPAGLYRFKTETDDGARLFLNDKKVLDHWRSQTFASHTADWNHPGGPLKVVMEYYDELGLAAARLTWERIGEATAGAPAPSGIWTAQYYNNSVLAAQPVVVQSEQAIDFDWNRGVFPHPQYITREGYSIRFKGTLNLPAGKYRFTVTVDDGARLWVNDQLIMDKWRKHPEITYTVDIELPGGDTPIQLEYFNIEADARILLSYDRLDGPLEVGEPGVPGTAAPSTASPGQSPEVVTGQVAKVRTAAARVRAEASSVSEVLTTLRRAQTAVVTGRTTYKTWLQIELPDGQVGWLSVLDVEPGLDIDSLPIAEPPAETPPETLPDGPKSIVVRSGLNQVREAPSMISKVIAVLPRNKAYPTLGRNRFGTWVKIELPDGRTGWVGAFYVTADYDLRLLPVTE
ncbi:MAG: PA14 domain-containing protein [Ardenticatenaceae bacterium]|nr:PA14 domain-containing protein [Ardenticatenaceae bacterium]